MNHQESFGQRFDRLRKERGLNRSEFQRLAYDETGEWIPMQTQKNWSLHPKMIPEAQTIRAIEVTLGVPLGHMLDGIVRDQVNPGAKLDDLAPKERGDEQAS